jgi:hypothetical protein
MNIFYLHRDVWQCAKMHCDVHVNKMILESAQLLSTAHHELGSTAPYKTTHKITRVLSGLGLVVISTNGSTGS